VLLFVVDAFIFLSCFEHGWKYLGLVNCISLLQIQEIVNRLVQELAVLEKHMAQFVTLDRKLSVNQKEEQTEKGKEEDNKKKTQGVLV